MDDGRGSNEIMNLVIASRKCKETSERHELG